MGRGVAQGNGDSGRLPSISRPAIGEDRAVMSSPPHRGAWLGALVSTCLTVAAFAQDTAVPNPGAGGEARGADRPTTARPEPDRVERRLPADVTTWHVLELPGRTLRL